MTIKSLTILDIDLIDSNEAILILNNLPNVQILNGKSTKEEEEEEYEDDEEDDNDNEDDINNIYLILFNKYKERISGLTRWGAKIPIINGMKQDVDFLKLSEEEQNNLVNELLSS